MKKIAILINAFNPGGAEKVVSLLMSHFVKKYDVKLILLSDEKLFYPVPDEVEVINFSNKINSSFMKLLMLPVYAFRLKRIVKKEKIEIVQSHMFRANYVNILSKLIFNSTHEAHIVNHSVPKRYVRQGLSGKVSILLIKKLFILAEKMVFLSKGMKKDFSNFINTENATVINNPYDIENIKHLAKENGEFDFKENVFYVVSLGRLIKLKRNGDLIKAAKKVSEKTNKDIKIIFVGDGEEKGELVKLSQNIGFENNVHFEGVQANPFPYILRSDLFVLASETEGFPNALVEAMSLCVPAISSDCVSGPREILNETDDYGIIMPKGTFFKAKHGILYPVGDVDALAEAILFMINNENERKRFAESGKKRAEDFSLEKIVEQYMETINK